MPQAFPNDERFAEADIILGNRSRNTVLPAIQQFLTNRVRINAVINHEMMINLKVCL